MSPVPHVRFNKFQNDWKEVSFSEIYIKTIQKNDLTFGNKDIISVANMHYSPNELVINEEYLRTYNTFLLGDIAFEGHSNADYAFGRFVENNIGDGIVSHVFKVFRPKTEFDLEYWKYFINNEKIMRSRLAVSTKSSTMMKELRDEAFLKQKVFVPSVEEQNCIGNLLKTVENLITYYEHTISIYDLLIKSRFVEMFGHIGQNEYNTPTKSLADVCNLITDGSHYSPADEPDGPYPMLSVKDLSHHGFDYTGCKHVGQKAYDKLVKDGCKPIKNDVLIAKDGSVFQKSMIVTEETDQVILSSIAIIRPNTEIMNPVFLEHYLMSDYVKADVILNYTTGTAIRRIILKNLAKLKLIVPSKDQQDLFASFVKQVDKSKFVAEQSLSRYQALFKALSEILFVNNPRQDN